MTEEEREEVYETLMANDQVIKSVCVIDHTRIDEINILEATMEAMAKSVEGLSTAADWVLIDGNRVPPPLVDRAEAIVKGDAKSVCISAASVLAKVTRDRMMVSLFLFFVFFLVWAIRMSSCVYYRLRSTRSIRSTGSTGTKGTGRRRTWRRFISTARARTTDARSRP